ncbi:MAG: AbiV family abortive infection protein, partial [Chlorobi bacterium]|nr:AbiV family abortive infection protein [Chlorobiota bacterium]
MKKEDIEFIKKIKSSCLNNAKNFIDASLKLDDHPNIQFHLAILALEEIGKVKIYQIQIINKTYGGVSNIGDSIDDHSRKLFSALIDINGLEKIMDNWKLIPNMKNIVSVIHNKRLKCLYVEPENDKLPMDVVTKEEAKNMIELAKFMIKKEELLEFNEDEGIDIDLNWFLDSKENTEKSRFIFSKVAVKKISEFENVREWIRWLRMEFEKEEIELKKLTEREMGVKKINLKDAKNEKWKIKVKIFSYSHSIRQKVINAWNKKDSLIKLYSTKNNNEFIFELVAPLTIHAMALFDYTLNYTKFFLLSLNIGTLGYFWYYLPHLTKRFY